MKLDIKELNFLNQLTSEIIILNKDLYIIWLNDSALNKDWVMHSNFNKNLISDQLSDETNSSLISLLKKTIENTGSQTKRDFELITSKQKKREIDITVRWSNTYKCLIVEILCVDNLNKIIDSTKTFSTQKIAANLARTLAHELKEVLKFLTRN
jgi:two-component system nitrogen regulation sensor histidine kinase GlnL